MLKVARRSLRAHIGRLALTTTVVLMGVAFVAAGQVLTDTIRASFDQAFTDIYAGTDGVVRSSDVIEAAFRQQRGSVSTEVADTVRATDGVRAAEVVVQRPVKVLAPDGSVLCNTQGGPPLFGLNWVEDPELSRWRIVEGDPPRAPDEVVIDPKLAEAEGFAVGDELVVPLPSGTATFRVVGIASFATTGNLSGASAVLFTTDTATTELVGDREADWIAVSADAGADQASLRDAIAAALPADAELEVLTGDGFRDENRSAFQEIFDLFNRILTVFGAVALFVSTFVIYNTFSLLVARRARELALLRAIGASRAQVVGSMVAEATIVGAVASFAGVVAGILLGWGVTGLLTNVGFVPPDAPLQVMPLAFLPALAMGVAVTVVAALFPAWRASRIPPVAALRDVAHDTVGASVLRTIVALAIGAAGAASLTFGLLGDHDEALAFVGFGMAGIFLGVAMLAPVVIAPLARVIGAPAARWRATPGRLARANASRNPRRSAATASAVMIGVGLVTFIAILGESLRAARTEVIERTVVADVVVDAQCAGLGGVSPQLSEDLGALDGVQEAVGFRGGLGRIGPRNQFVIGTDAEALQAVLDLEVVDGDLSKVQGSVVAIPKALAERFGWELGSTVTMDFTGYPAVPIEIGAIVDSRFLARGGVLISRELFEASFPEVLQADLQVYVRLEDPNASAAVLPSIEAVVERYPPAQAQDLRAFTAQQTAPIDRFVFFVWALLLLAVLISVIGVLNTVLLSVYERTRELGLLRAAGMARSQVRSAVRWESVIITLIGTALGLTIGVFFGWAIVRAGGDVGFDTFAVPWNQVAIIVAVAFSSGLAAAVWPARRAANLDVLAAIAHE